MSKEEQEDFDCDPMNIDWDQYVREYALGLQLYVSGQDVPLESHGFTQIIAINKRLFDDVAESFKRKKGLKEKSFIDENKVIDEKRFLIYIKQILQNQNADQSKLVEILSKPNFRYNEVFIRNEVNRMNRCISVKSVNGLFYMFHKIFR